MNFTFISCICRQYLDLFIMLFFFYFFFSFILLLDTFCFVFKDFETGLQLTV